MAACWTDEQLAEAIRTSKTRSEVIIKLYGGYASNNHKTINRAIKRLRIDISHLEYTWKAGSPPKFEAGKLMNARVIKSAFLKLVAYECVLCKNPGSHAGKPLVLQLDHVDGDKLNNTLQNLRLLCPNCHTQTATYGAMKSPLKKDVSVRCVVCKVYFPKDRKAYRTAVIKEKTNFCCSPKCIQKQQKTVVKRKATDEEVAAAFVTGRNYRETGKILGMSDKAVKKRLVSLDLVNVK